MKKIVILIVLFIIVFIVAFFGWIQISRQIAIKNFKNEVLTYLDNRYIEKMYVNEVNISLTEGIYATAYPEGKEFLEFNIRKIDDKIVDGYLANCLETELSEIIKNDILKIESNYKCIVSLNGNSLIEENLYELYKNNNRPAKIDELTQFPDVEHVLLSFENNSNMLSEDEIREIVKILYENFNDKIFRLGIFENDKTRLSLGREGFSEFIEQ